MTLLARFSQPPAWVLVALILAGFPGLALSDPLRFGTPYYVLEGPLANPRIVDLDGDGVLDIVNEDGWFPGQASLPPAAKRSFSGHGVWTGLVVHDLDHDGRLRGSGRRWHRRTAGGVDRRGVRRAPAHRSTDVRAERADPDGLVSGFPQIVSVLGDGHGNALRREVTQLNASIPNGTIQLGQLDYDGHPDLFTGRTAFHGTASGRFSETPVTLSIEQSWTLLADIDQDGLSDVFIEDQFQLGHGDGVFDPVPTEAPIRPSSVDDLDHDGVLDLVGTHSGETAVALANGVADFGTPQLYPGSLPCVGDMDGDGWNDLMTLKYVLYNIAAIAPNPPHVDFTAGPPQQVAIGTTVELRWTVSAEFDAVSMALETLSESFGITQTNSAPPAPTAFSFAITGANPFRDRLGLRYQLVRPGPVKIELIDIRGRRVATLESGIRDAGARSMSWTPGKGLAPGVYVLLFEGDGRRLSRRVVFAP